MPRSYPRNSEGDLTCWLFMNEEVRTETERIDKNLRMIIKFESQIYGFLKSLIRILQIEDKHKEYIILSEDLVVIFRVEIKILLVEAGCQVQRQN